MSQMHLVLTGDKALVRALRTLPAKVERRVLGNAARAAMRPLVTAAKRNALTLGRGKEKLKVRRERRAQKQDYRLAETIGQVTRTYKGAKVVVVGPMYEGFGLKGRVGHLVEKGHEIKLPRRGMWKHLLKHKAGGRVRPYPFMKPAWDATVARAKQVLVEKLRAGIEREAAAARGR
jgi:hypothetical protein